MLVRVDVLDINSNVIDSYIKSCKSEAAFVRYCNTLRRYRRNMSDDMRQYSFLKIYIDNVLVLCVD